MLVIGVALGLTLGACEMRAEVVVHEDGSGTIGMAFGLEPLVINSLPSGEMDPFDAFMKTFQASDLPWRIHTFDEPGLEGMRATLPFSSFEELTERVDQIASSDMGGGGG